MSDKAKESTPPLKFDFLNLIEVEEKAKALLPKMAFDYYRGGSGSEHALAENRSAYQLYNILPRMLVDVSNIDTSITLFGMDMKMPVMVAPMAMHGMAHADREIGTARAAASKGIPFCFSTMANSSQEEIANLSGNPNRLFQLYVIRNRSVVRHWVTEAERLGFKALVVTVDAQRLGRRETDERNRFTLPDGLELKVLEPLLKSLSASDASAQGRKNDVGSGLGKMFADQIDDSLTWDFIPWVKSITKLPVLVKGLLSPDDCTLALMYGADGIIVSNHGGRQMDCAPSALEMLPAIVKTVRGRCPIIMDGGIRRGTDVMKALALGADAVLLGRPVLYGLAVGGQAGVEQVLQLLQAELELGMALSGCRCISDIGQHLLLPSLTSRL